MWVKNEIDFSIKRAHGRDTRKDDFMKSFDKVKNDETGKIEDIYDVDTDILRSLDVKKIM